MKIKTSIIVRYPGEGSLTLVEEMGDATPEQILEKVFAWCNSGSHREHPKFLAWRKRSLSVNDFVCINGFWWQCRGVGWEKCCARYVIEIEEKVAAHPMLAEFGAWSVLGDVMFELEKAAKTV